MFHPKQGITGGNSTPLQRLKLCKMKSIRIMTAGETEAGKTSTMQSVATGRAHRTKKPDRTELAETSMWKPHKSESNVISVVDIGGHKSYKATSLFFSRNSCHNVVALCHDITNPLPDKTFHWLDNLLFNAPDSHFTFLLTKADQTDANGQERKKTVFQDKLKRHLEVLKRDLTAGIAYAHEHQLNHEYTQAIMKMLGKCQKLIEDIPKTTFLTSCVPGYEHTIQILREHFLKLLDEEGTHSYLKEEHQLLYQKIGKVGIDLPRETDEATATEPFYMPQPKTQSTREKREMRFFTYLKAKLKPKKTTQLKFKARRLGADEARDVIHLSTEHTFDDEKLQNVPYMLLNDVKEIYQQILDDLNLATENLYMDTIEALDTLHKQGHLLYFRESENLRNVVFNDMAFFVSILRAVFHHDNTLLNLDEYGSSVYTGLNAAKNFEKDMELLRHSGVITEQLLRVMLKKHKCDIDAKTVHDLLNRMDIAYSFKDTDRDKSVLFVPYYIRKTNISDIQESKV